MGRFRYRHSRRARQAVCAILRCAGYRGAGNGCTCDCTESATVYGQFRQRALPARTCHSNRRPRHTRRCRFPPPQLFRCRSRDRLTSSLRLPLSLHGLRRRLTPAQAALFLAHPPAPAAPTVVDEDTRFAQTVAEPLDLPGQIHKSIRLFFDCISRHSLP